MHQVHTLAQPARTGPRTMPRPAVSRSCRGVQGAVSQACGRPCRRPGRPCRRPGRPCRRPGRPYRSPGLAPCCYTPHAYRCAPCRNSYVVSWPNALYCSAMPSYRDLRSPPSATIQTFVSRPCSQPSALICICICICICENMVKKVNVVNTQKLI